MDLTRRIHGRVYESYDSVLVIRQSCRSLNSSNLYILYQLVMETMLDSRVNKLHQTPILKGIGWHSQQHNHLVLKAPQFLVLYRHKGFPLKWHQENYCQRFISEVRPGLAQLLSKHFTEGIDQALGLAAMNSWSGMKKTVSTAARGTFQIWRARRNGSKSRKVWLDERDQMAREGTGSAWQIYPPHKHTVRVVECKQWDLPWQHCSGPSSMGPVAWLHGGSWDKGSRKITMENCDLWVVQ